MRHVSATEGVQPGAPRRPNATQVTVDTMSSPPSSELEFIYNISDIEKLDIRKLGGALRGKKTSVVYPLDCRQVSDEGDGDGCLTQR